jgi:hypothetical protein
MSDWEINRISENDFVYKVDGAVMGHETSFARAAAKLEEIQRTERSIKE